MLFVNLGMEICLCDLQNGNVLSVRIELIQKEDLSKIKSNKGFNFDWQKEKDVEIYKLFNTENDEILGLLSVADRSETLVVEIRLLESVATNVGKNKRVEGVAGCLIAWACRLSFIKGYDGWVMLTAKTALIKYYCEKYGMKQIGKSQVCVIEQDQSYKLIQYYLEGGISKAR
jgi:hypothetical protein